MQSNGSNGLHVAIIMDGNGRWATRRGLPRAAGHRAGVAAVRRAVEHAPELGIRTLTVYAFSADNWRRPGGEVQTIFWLLRAYLRLEREKLRKQGARLEAIGRRDRIPPALLREIEDTEAATAGCDRLHLRVAIDYSSREAITMAAARAVKSAACSAGQEMRLSHLLPSAEADDKGWGTPVDSSSGAKAPTSSQAQNGRPKGRTLHSDEAFNVRAEAGTLREARSLRDESPRVRTEARILPPVDTLRPILTEALTADCGEVDLLIRTGGEKRLSDFLLWESAYAELYFTDRMWPEFDGPDLAAAVAEFRHRQRRFGGVPEAALLPMAVCAVAAR